MQRPIAPASAWPALTHSSVRWLFRTLRQPLSANIPVNASTMVAIAIATSAQLGSFISFLSSIFNFECADDPGADPFTHVIALSGVASADHRAAANRGMLLRLSLK